MTNLIPLYGRYPAHHSDPSEILAIVQQNYHDIRHRQELPRDEYPILPWAMHQLPGTTWRNVHTTTLTTVQEVRENKWEKPGPDPDPCINAMFSIGLWSNDRFVIGHWVRVDHLSIETQMNWHILAVTRCGKATTKAQTALQKQKQTPYDSCQTPNTNLRKRDLERTRQNHTRAITQMTRFAALHHTPVPTNIEFADLPLFAATTHERTSA